MGYGQYSAQARPSQPSIEAKSTKRLKHVFDNPSHVWAHPRQKDGSGFEQTEAWNGQKNFFFRTIDSGDVRVLYSYRDTYPVGSTFVHKKKQVYLVRSGQPYSVTTAGHMSCAKQAVPHGAIRFDVPLVTDSFYSRRPTKETHTANIADIIARAIETIQKYERAKSLRVIQWALTQAGELLDQAKGYAKLFDAKLPKLPAISKLTKERRIKALTFDNTRTDRENKKNAAREARWAEQRRLDALSRDEKIAAWRSGAGVRLYDLNGYALLRVIKSNVETSQNVTVPINGMSGAGRLLRFLTACKEANRSYERNGHTEHIGNFTVESFKPAVATPTATDETKPEWILTAGCHRIKWEEIVSISDAVREAYKPE